MKIPTRFLNVFSVLKSMLFAQETKFGNIDIKGSKEFREKISSALDLLKQRDPQIFEVVNKSLNWIIEGNETMLSLTRWGGTLSLSEEYVKASPTWLAGVLVFYGARSGLYLENIKKYGNSHKVPKELYSGDKVCDLYYESLQRLGANYEELKHLADSIETR